MSWDTEKRRKKRSRLATIAMLALASVGTAVGATGLRSLTEAMTADRDALPRLSSPAVPVIHADAPSLVAVVVAPADAVATPATPTIVLVPAPALAPSDVVLAPIGGRTPAPRGTIANGLALLSTTPARHETYVAPAVPTFSIATPADTHRVLTAGGLDDAVRPAGHGALSANGKTIEIVDAGALPDLGPVADGSPRPIFRPRPSGPLNGAGLPPEALDPALGEIADRAPTDAGRPLDEPVGLPYEVIVDAGNTELLPPRVVGYDGWTPEDGLPDGEARTPLQYLYDRDNNLVRDANGLPVLAPEPTTLLAVAGAALALAGRRRRRD